ncbi:MAG: PilZ domain-containing protein [Myxococcota bacterium]
MQDRRRSARASLLVYPEVEVFLGEKALKAHMADLSRTGVLLLCPDRLEPRRAYELQVIVPPPYDRDVPGSQLRFQALCCWSRSARNPERFEAGLEFLHMDPPVLRMLMWIQDQLDICA